MQLLRRLIDRFILWRMLRNIDAAAVEALAPGVDAVGGAPVRYDDEYGPPLQIIDFDPASSNVNPETELALPHTRLDVN